MPTAHTAPLARTGQCALALAALTLAGGAVLTGCTPQQWVVESVGYHGPRGHGTHYVTCIPIADNARARSDRQRWREVQVSAEQGRTLDEGAPCPAGPILETTG